MTVTELHGVIEAVWRTESARLMAGLVRLVGDIAIAEDLAQDTMMSALERWPSTGVPDNPAAWLTSAARHRAIDVLRRQKLLERKHEQLGAEIAGARAHELDTEHEALDDEVGDELLRLMFMTCHPVLSTEARVALTLRLVGGLTSDEVARAFLVPVATVQQRIVRAKRMLTEERVPFAMPRGPELGVRLASVLEVIYLVFNEGYAATAGDDWMRPGLCDSALRLGRILAEVAPGEPEVHGLVALMEIQASRVPARTGPSGEPVLLLEQDRARWDYTLVERGLDALARAESLGGGPGPYVLQAAIAACHARAATAEDTDWTAIAALYDALARLAPSPVVELNRAVAYAMAFGADAGLQIADELLNVSALRNYHLLPAVRADLLLKLGRAPEAREEFLRAAALTKNRREQGLLIQRAAQCLDQFGQPELPESSRRQPPQPQ